MRFGYLIVASAVMALAACGGDDEENEECTGAGCATDLCAGVTCSGHGTCTVSEGAAKCNCSAGYHAVGLTCVADSTSTFAGSCSVADAYSCIDYVGSGFTATQVQQACAAGAYSAAHCSTANLVGKCQTGGGTAVEAVTYWYAPMDAGIAQTACTTSGGVWTAG